MADKFARLSGDFYGPIWSLTAGGVAGSTNSPTIGDIAYANNCIVAITGTAAATSFTNGAGSGATNGGYFLVHSNSNNISLTGHVGLPITSTNTNIIILSGSQNISMSGNIYSGFGLPTAVAHSAIGVNSFCVNNTVSLTGSIFLGSAISNTSSGTNYGLIIQPISNSIYNIIGNISYVNQRNSQQGLSQVVRNLGTSTINLSGNIFGASGNIGGDVSLYSQRGNINHIGNVLGTVGDAINNGAIHINGGVYNLNTSTLFSFSSYQYGNTNPLIYVDNGIANINARNIVGGLAANANFNKGYVPVSIVGGVVNIVGDCKAGDTFSAVTQTGGTLNVIGNATCSTLPVNAITSSGGTFYFSGNVINAPNGIPAIYAVSCIFTPTITNGYIAYAKDGAGINDDSYQYQFTSDSFTTFSLPPVSSVRAGILYSGVSVGTCNMPQPSAVAYGTVYDSNNSKFGLAINRDNVIFNTLLNNLSVINSVGDKVKKSSTNEATGHLIASFSN